MLVILTSACTGSTDDDESAGSTSVRVSEVESSSVGEGLPMELGVVEASELPCRSSVVDAPDDFEQVLDVVALPTSPGYPNALQTSAREAEDGTVYYFAKTGLWWRGDATFEIVVPAELQSSMAIGWGWPAKLSHDVVVDCGLSDSWMAMPGGYWVREPICAAVIVRAGSEEQRVEIGLGEPCAGQAPPVGPNDG